MLQGLGQVVAVTVVKIGRHVDSVKHSDVTLFVGMGSTAASVFAGPTRSSAGADWHKGGVFDFVDTVLADHGSPAPLGDEQDVIAFQKLDKACKKEATI